MRPGIKTTVLGRLAGDRRGISAVEFALIAPLMVLLYCGLAEITLAMMAERRAGHTASAIGDLVAQDSTVTKAEVADIFTVGSALVYPFPSGGLSMRLTSVRADANGAPLVVWCQVKGTALPKLSPDAPVAGLPADFLAANESAIMSEVSYGFDTPIKYVLPQTLNFKETFYLRPRKSDAVACADCASP